MEAFSGVKRIWRQQKRGCKLDSFRDPTDLCILPNSDIVVAESVRGNSRIKIVNSDHGKGRYVFKLGVRGVACKSTGSSQFIATSDAGKTVKVLNAYSGLEVSTWSNLDLTMPWGATYSENYDNWIITDNGKCAVCICDGSGRVVRKFENKGQSYDGPGLLAPYYVTTDQRNRILVSDWGNNCVKIYDRYGKFLFSIRENLFRPRGIATDARGNILVCDSKNHSHEGRYIKDILTIYNGITWPQAVQLLSGRNQLVVAYGESDAYDTDLKVKHETEIKNCPGVALFELTGDNVSLDSTVGA